MSLTNKPPTIFIFPIYHRSLEYTFLVFIFCYLEYYISNHSSIMDNYYADGYVLLKNDRYSKDTQQNLA